MFKIERDDWKKRSSFFLGNNLHQHLEVTILRKQFSWLNEKKIS